MSFPAQKLCGRALAIAGTALLMSGATAGAATPPAPRYATPNPASSPDCLSVNKACDLASAISGATPGGEVVVLPGTYTLGGTPLIDPQGKTLNIHGLDPQHRPVITSRAPVALEVDDTASTITDLDLRDTNHSGAALRFRGLLADRILARAPGNAGACELALKTTLRNSVCVASNPNTAAVRIYGYGATNPVTLRNVTAIATDPSGFGVSADQQISGGASFQVTLINTIARVAPLDPDAVITGFDISANTNFGPITVIAQDSNWGIGRTAGNGTSIDIAGKQTQLPRFVNPAAFDYHEDATSPTIGGVTFFAPADPANGATDFDGDARAFIAGGALANSTDIGADEYVAPVVVTTTTTTTTTPPPTTTTPPPPTTTTPIGPDKTPPTFSATAIAPTGFAVKIAGKRAKARIRYGAQVRFAVSEPAGVVATVQQKTTGRKVGKLCKKQSKSNKTKGKCTLWASKGRAFSKSVALGKNTVTFSGKLGTHKLAPGVYRLQLVATDVALNKSLPKTLQFKIVRG